MMLLLAAEVFAYHMSQDSSQSALQEKDDALQETRNELLGVRQRPNLTNAYNPG